MAEQISTHPELGVGFRSGPATYRRRIEVVPGEGFVEAAMEDYIHHFRVRLTHDGSVILAAEATGVRVPWTTCPTGAAGLGALAGTTLDDALLAERWMDDRRTQCVHTVDLAAVAAAHAGDEGPTVYEIRVELTTFLERRATLSRDGEPLLDWQLDGQRIVRGGSCTDETLDRAAFTRWLVAKVPPADREPVVVLRRACTISMGRLMDLDVIGVAADVRGADESCHTYRTGVAETARRCVGTARETEVDEPGTSIPGGPLSAVAG